METRADLNLDFSVAVVPAPGRTVVEARGELDIAAAPLLRQALIEAQTNPSGEPVRHPVVIDLSRATFLDACALGVLAAAVVRARRAGSALVLRDPTRPVMRVLEITGLLPVFCMECSDAMPAVESREVA